jgi:hypothetical protein
VTSSLRIVAAEDRRLPSKSSASAVAEAYVPIVRQSFCISEVVSRAILPLSPDPVSPCTVRRHILAIVVIHDLNLKLKLRNYRSPRFLIDTNAIYVFGYKF